MNKILNTSFRLVTAMSLLAGSFLPFARPFSGNLKNGNNQAHGQQEGFNTYEIQITPRRCQLDFAKTNSLLKAVPGGEQVWRIIPLF